MTRARDLANIADGTFTATDLNLSGTLDVSGDANFDSGTLFVDVSANNVGIGTTSPDFTLDVAGGITRERSSSGSTASPVTDQVVGLNAGGNFAAGVTAINTNSSNFDVSLGFVTRNASGDGVERVRIDADGNVGIGTSTINERLVLGSADSGSNFLQITNSTTTAANDRGLYVGIDANEAARVLNRENTDLIFSTNNTEAMWLRSNGNLGIGTSGAATPLEVQTSTDNSAYIRVGTSSNGGHTIGDDLAALEFYGADSSGSGAGVKGSIRYQYGSTSGATTHMAFAVADVAGSNDVERMRLDSDGTLLVNRASAFTTAKTEIQSDVGDPLTLALNSIDSDGNILSFYKAGSPVGSISTVGSAVYMGTGNTRLLFRDASNDIRPVVSGGTNRDDVTDLGAASARFDNIYATNGTIQTSDANEKQDVEELSEAEHRVAVACKGLLRKFRWISRVEEKGDDARIHFGIIAQDLQAAFEAEGLDAGRYAMFIHSTWTDEETGEERSRMGVRYSELLAFIIAAL